MVGVFLITIIKQADTMQDIDFLSRVLPPEGDYYVAKQLDDKRFIESRRDSLTSVQTATDNYSHFPPGGIN